MALFEIIIAKKIEAEDFFDAVEKSKKENNEVLSISHIAEEEEDVLD